MNASQYNYLFYCGGFGGCLQFLANINKAAMNISEHGFCYTYAKNISHKRND